MSNILVPLILFISSIGLFFTYLSPGYETLQAFKSQEERLDGALEKFGQVMKKKTELTDQYVSFRQQDLDMLKLITPHRVDVVQAIIILDTLAQQNDIYVESFGVPSDADAQPVRRADAPQEEQQEFGTATFRLSLVGGYSDIKNFLYGIERSATVMDVVELIINPTKDLPNTYTVSLALNTYWLY